ncbi:MAG: tail fiber domain-containing protein [Lewinellaceae bacterium]|nr:tail fiber domain-containing protein [Lewinellaceae bacterium]
MKQPLLITLLFFLLAGNVQAQAPQAFNYQGVARNTVGTPLPAQAISLRLSILADNASGTTVYAETHSITTNQFGLFTAQIGQGTAVSGNFALIGWEANNHFLKVEIDPSGGSAYTQVGVPAQLISVPYALEAQHAAVATALSAPVDISGDVTGTANNTTVSRLQGKDVSNTMPTDGQVLRWNQPAGRWEAATLSSGPGGDNWGTQTAITGSTLSGNGTAANPLQIAPQGATNSQVLKWNGTAWLPGNDIDNQQLSISSNVISLSNGGGSVTLPPSSGTDAQILNLTGNQLSITNGNTVTLPAEIDGSVTNELQTISISGNTISLSQSGGSVTLPPGPQGPIGLTGATGPQGPIGLTGATGSQGPIGLTGATGPQGPIGLTGATGPQGPIGLTGATGPQGPIGLTGATGPQGPIGLTGATGPQGPIGASGPQGLTGETGATGPVGATGPQGPVGATGPAGPTYSAGTGISITGTTIINTGDTNAADDLTTSSIASGDVTGPFNNLQIAASAVGTTEIANGAVTGTKIAQSGAATGQVLSWNGTTWAPASGGSTSATIWNNNIFSPSIAHNLDAIDQVLISRTPGSATVEAQTVLTVDGQNASKTATFKTNNTTNGSHAVEILVQGTAPSFTNPVGLYIENEPFLDSGDGIEVHAGGTGIIVEGGLQGILVTSSNLGPAGNFTGGTGVIGTGQSTGLSGAALYQDNTSAGVRGNYAGNGSFNGVGVEGRGVPSNATIPGDKGFGIGGRFTGGNKGIWAERTDNPMSTYLTIANFYDKYYGSTLLPMAGYFKSNSSVGLFSEAEGGHAYNDGISGFSTYGMGLVGRHNGGSDFGVGVYGTAEGDSDQRIGVMGYAEGGSTSLGIGVKGMANGDLGIGGSFVAAQGLNIEATRAGLVVQAPTNDFIGFSIDPIIQVLNLNPSGASISTNQRVNIASTGNSAQLNIGTGATSFLDGIGIAGGEFNYGAHIDIAEGTASFGAHPLGTNVKGFEAFTAAGTAVEGIAQTGIGGYFESNSGTGTALVALGKAAIGTASPGSYSLKIKGQGLSNFGLNIENASNTSNWEIYADGNLNFLSGTGTYAQLNAAGMWINSDRRLKRNELPMATVLDRIGRLRPLSYEMTTESNGLRRIGFFAQELQTEFPELVEDTPNRAGETMLSVNYGSMSVVALKAIQEQQQQIAAMKAEKTDLEARLSRLEQQNRALETRLQQLEKHMTKD